MRVLLVSEGAHELGAWDESGLPTGPSALETFCRRLLGQEVEFVRKKVSDPEVRTHRMAGKGDGYEKRVLMWMRRAELEGFDALVLVIDQDDPAERRQQQLDRAQDDGRFPIRRALGVAIRTFDAWILADEKALSLALGSPCKRQKEPEGFSEPKAVCRELLEQSSSSCASVSHFYAAVAEHADLGQVAERCRRGFAPFARRMREL